MTVKVKAYDLHHFHTHQYASRSITEPPVFFPELIINGKLQLYNMIHITYQELKEFLSSPILAMKPQN